MSKMIKRWYISALHAFTTLVSVCPSVRSILIHYLNVGYKTRYLPKPAAIEEQRQKNKYTLFSVHKGDVIKNSMSFRAMFVSNVVFITLTFGSVIDGKQPILKRYII